MNTFSRAPIGLIVAALAGNPSASRKGMLVDKRRLGPSLQPYAILQDVGSARTDNLPQHDRRHRCPQVHDAGITDTASVHREHQSVCRGVLCDRSLLSKLAEDVEPPRVSWERLPDRLAHHEKAQRERIL